MSVPSAYWFSPTPSELSSSRLSLDFGLRAADLFFRELVVPGLGRIWFVRQLSWPLAALAVRESMREQRYNAPRATVICHAIEALACKLEYCYGDRDSRRVLGKRAFGREEEVAVWAFDGLRQPAHYVRNTHRQAATRALRMDSGLGFAEGSRFDLLRLTPIGRGIADAFLAQRVGQGGASLRQWLIAWIRGENDIPEQPNSLARALSPEHQNPTQGERDLVRARVLEVETPACVTRKRLAHVIGNGANLPDIEHMIVPRLRDADHKKQADEILAARSFGAMLDRMRDVVAALTGVVEPGRGAVAIIHLVRDPKVNEALEHLTQAAKNFVERADIAAITEPTSRTFARAFLNADGAARIRLLVDRADQMLSLSDQSVIRGALFRVIAGADSDDDLDEPDRMRRQPGVDPLGTKRSFRLSNLHSLLRDTQRGAAG